MPPTQTSRDDHRAAIKPVLALLAERWPRCFTLNSRKRKPLAVGIRAEIERQLPEVDPRLLRKALRSYVVSMAYQRASMIAGTVRVTLDGSAGGTVSTIYTTSDEKTYVMLIAVDDTNVYFTQSDGAGGAAIPRESGFHRPRGVALSVWQLFSAACRLVLPR